MSFPLRNSVHATHSLTALSQGLWPHNQTRVSVCLFVRRLTHLVEYIPDQKTISLFFSSIKNCGLQNNQFQNWENSPSNAIKMIQLASVILLIHLQIQDGVCTWLPTEAKNPNRQDVSWGHSRVVCPAPKALGWIFHSPIPQTLWARSLDS